jgi:hypothetical protein
LDRFFLAHGHEMSEAEMDNLKCMSRSKRKRTEIITKKLRRRFVMCKA